ncbi:uncharacterized protein LOC134826904 [Culicoides brevitarsis]|uniref:uncharacterized protein LOC134826904 n=1 Tax=Culicoides brevitarsis TaxID=469753 RepID=UPI00307C5E4D
MDSDQLHQHKKTILINSILKECPIDQLPGLSSENKENIKKYINYLLVKDYLFLDNDNVILGLSSEATAEPKLSYTETKALKEYIEQTLVKTFKPMIAKIKEQEAEGYDEKGIERRRQEFLEKQKELQAKQLELVELKKEKLELLQRIAEIRTGPDQKQQVENLHNEAKLDNIKLGMLEKVISNSFTKTTGHTTKAIKTVEKHIDAMLNNES